MLCVRGGNLHMLLSHKLANSRLRYGEAKRAEKLRGNDSQMYATFCSHFMLRCVAARVDDADSGAGVGVVVGVN